MNQMTFIITATIILLFVIVESIFQLFLKRPTAHNNPKLVRGARICYVLCGIIIADMMLDSSGFPGTCSSGSSLTGGNCFLLDGFSMVAYVPVLMVLSIACFILLVVNYSRKDAEYRKSRLAGSATAQGVENNKNML